MRVSVGCACVAACLVGALEVTALHCTAVCGCWNHGLQRARSARARMRACVRVCLCVCVHGRVHGLFCVCVCCLGLEGTSAGLQSTPGTQDWVRGVSASAEGVKGAAP